MRPYALRSWINKLRRANRTIRRSQLATVLPRDIAELETRVMPYHAMFFQDGINGYAGTSDTYISSAATGTNVGAATTSNVNWLTATTGKQALLRFDNLFGTNQYTQVPANALIRNAF